MHDIPLRETLTRDYFRRVGRAWERVLSASPIDDAGVRDIVLESWRRCREQGVDPRRSAAPMLASGDALQQLYHDNARLFGAIKACIAPAVSRLDGTNTVLITSDPLGTLLTVDGDPPLAGRMQDTRVVPGACWGEDHGGTNAIGTALALGRPVQIHSQEHFCEAGKSWSCNASVIHDPIDQQILGAVDVTGPEDLPVMQAGPLVATLVARIEGYLLSLDLAERGALVERYDALVSPGEAALLCDARGRVLRINTEAQAALGRRGIEPARLLEKPIDGLRGEALDRVDPRGLPDWLEPDWLTPLRQGGRWAGALVRIPASRRAGRPARLGSLAAEFRVIAEASPSLLPQLRQAECFAHGNVPILIEGETGTGKDLLAQAIHAAGPAKAGPFIPLNCAALPKDILAAELFGHAEGAFTGARRGGAKGRFEQAHGGTMFLDEIGDMPLELQPYLLRILEERLVWRLGESRPRPINVRIIAATHHALGDEVEAGRFRADLYHRLCVATITLLPLRQRIADLPLLARHLLGQIARSGGRELRIGDDVMRRLMRHGWPGNVRELRNRLETMALLASGDELQQLPEGLAAGGRNRAAFAVDAPPARPSASLRSVEEQAILAALRREGGNMSRTARALGISRATLYRRISAYGNAVAKSARSA